VGDEKAGSVTAGSAFEQSPVLSRSASVRERATEESIGRVSSISEEAADTPAVSAFSQFKRTQQGPNNPTDVRAEHPSSSPPRSPLPKDRKSQSPIREQGSVPRVRGSAKLESSIEDLGGDAVTPASGAAEGLKKRSMVAEMKRRMREDKCDNPSCKNMEEDGRKFEFKCNKCARVKYCSKVSALSLMCGLLRNASHASILLSADLCHCTRSANGPVGLGTVLSAKRG
jgi:hypothetical protein